MKKNLEKSKAHSELSASGSERWLNCPASVKLSREVDPPATSKWALEGTIAHELFEDWVTDLIIGKKLSKYPIHVYPMEMQNAVTKAVDHIKKIWDKDTEELITEEKVSLEFIHPTMFGTADIQIIEDFGTLQVWDYKHGAGHAVDLVTKNQYGIKTFNTQLVYYMLAVAYKYDFNFSKFRIGVIQPRCAHPKGKIRSVDLTLKELKSYIDLFKRGVDRVYSKNPSMFVGSWCHWCPAKKICPKQDKIRFDKDTMLFDDL